MKTFQMREQTNAEKGSEEIEAIVTGNEDKSEETNNKKDDSDQAELAFSSTGIANITEFRKVSIKVSILENLSQR